MCPPAHFCAHRICISTNNALFIKNQNKNFIQFRNTYPKDVFIKSYFIHSPYLRRYTFLSHLTTKSKISVRWIKKLVAATFCVQEIIQSQNFIANWRANKKRTKSCTFYELYSISAPLNPLPRISSTSLIPINASLSILFIMLFKIEISLLST